MTRAPLPDEGMDICPNCSGSGVGVADTTCSLCNGTGGVPTTPLPERSDPVSERAAVVAWLRKQAGMAIFRSETCPERDVSAHCVEAGTYTQAAMEIERGDHLSPEKE